MPLPFPGDAPPGGGRCIVLFARAPRDEAAAKKLIRGERFFARLLHETAARAAALPGVDLLVASEASVPLPRGARRVRQSGGSFGQRLESALTEARRRGYEQIVVIGGDTPGLRTSDLAAAFEKLSDHEVVLGPAPDGGVYLIGLRVNPAGLFEGISWCTPRVFGQLRDRGGSVAILCEIRHDVDGFADLRELLIHGRLGLTLAGLAAAVTQGPAAAPHPDAAAPGRRSDHFIPVEAQRPPPAQPRH